MKTWCAEKPSNIALIKYMGKKDKELNIPSNRSFSWTLNHLKSRVQLEMITESEDCWQPLESDFPFELSKKGKEKFLGHLKRIKNYFNVNQSFRILSANNFPADCGIASSASSFAALTEVCFQAFGELSSQKYSIEEKALMSARGSGSSCRSFWPGFVLWDDRSVGPIEASIKDLLHMVVLVGAETKKVSSSDAHKKVETSLLFPGRMERTEVRLNQLLVNLNVENWENLYQIVWQEFWDMHALFETSQPSFSYFSSDTFAVLSAVRSFWEIKGDGPIVTMDAGPNVHLLWRNDQESLGMVFFENHLKRKWSTLSNFSGIGFDQV